MNRIFFFILVILIFLQAASFAASSASYHVSVEAVESGGGTSESTNYMLLAKMRDRQIDFPSSTTYRIGAGFLRSIFFGPILPPFIVSISPNYGYNDGGVFATISGGNFHTTGLTTVELRLTGEPTITATGVAVPSASSITCGLDLRGKKTGFWTVYVNNDGFESTLVSAFEVRAAKVKIVGPALNFPNPFNPDKEPTVIKYTLTQDVDIIINLYSISGEKVWSRKFPSGSEGGKTGLNQVVWDGRNVFDASVPNGVYVCQIMTSRGKTLDIIKIAVLR